MIKSIEDREGPIFPYVLKRFKRSPWEELVKEYFEAIERRYGHKLDDNELTGGSRLYKFMNKMDWHKN